MINAVVILALHVALPFCVSQNTECAKGTFITERDMSKVPRISVWSGKVNQHYDIQNGMWKTDPDKKSGADLNKLTYCKKWYPYTTSIRDTQTMETIKFCSGGRTETSCSYSSTRTVYECVAATTTDLNTTHTCVICPKDTYNDQIGQTSCKPCVDNDYVDQTSCYHKPGKQSSPSPNNVAKGSDMVYDYSNNNKKCDNKGNTRVFVMRGSDATVAKCKAKCKNDNNCKTFSIQAHKFCIGCNVCLSLIQSNTLSYKKVGQTCTTDTSTNSKRSPVTSTKKTCNTTNDCPNDAGVECGYDCLEQKCEIMWCNSPPSTGGAAALIIGLVVGSIVCCCVLFVSFFFCSIKSNTSRLRKSQGNSNHIQMQQPAQQRQQLPQSIIISSQTPQGMYPPQQKPQQMGLSSGTMVMQPIMPISVPMNLVQPVQPTTLSTPTSNVIRVTPVSMPVPIAVPTHNYNDSY